MQVSVAGVAKGFWGDAVEQVARGVAGCGVRVDVDNDLAVECFRADAGQGFAVRR